jgi:hypothetical protein
LLLVLSQQLGAELDVEIWVLQLGNRWPVLKAGAFWTLKIGRLAILGITCINPTAPSTE